MSAERPNGDGAGGDPGEGRLVTYLEELREDPPRSDVALVQRVAHLARWQQGVRAPLQALGLLAAAVLDGIAGLFGTNRRAGR